MQFKKGAPLKVFFLLKFNICLSLLLHNFSCDFCRYGFLCNSYVSSCFIINLWKTKRCVLLIIFKVLLQISRSDLKKKNGKLILNEIFVFNVKIFLMKYWRMSLLKTNWDRNTSSIKLCTHLSSSLHFFFLVWFNSSIASL